MRLSIFTGNSGGSTSRGRTRRWSLNTKVWIGTRVLRRSEHDRTNTARLQECGWMSVPLVVDDVRKCPLDLVARMFRHLERTPLAG